MFENEQQRHMSPVPGGQVESFLFAPFPDRGQCESDLEWMCAGLKNTLFYSDGLDLIPLTETETHAMVMRLLDAWNDDELRQGYLPKLPREALPIRDILRNWSAAPTSLYYRIQSPHHTDTLGYIGIDFSETASHEVEGHVNYGTLHRDFLRQGIMVTALGIVMRGLGEEIPHYGFTLKRLVTTVSDRNIGSMKVLERNGFRRDWTKELTPSPSTMGGMSIPVEFIFPDYQTVLHEV